MSAPVRIEARAWGDLRFATLARLLGLVDADHALIKVARLWSWQTEHFAPDAPTYEVDADTIESVLGPGGPAAMVRAKLADETPTGYRIRGTEGQIEWCDNLSSKRQHAGRARADGARRDAKGRLLPHGFGDAGNNSPANTPAPIQHPSSASPAKSSAPSPSPEEEISPARDPAVPSPAPDPQESEQPLPTELPELAGPAAQNRAGSEPPEDRRPIQRAAPPAEGPTARTLWAELEQARAEAGREMGVEVMPLAIGDVGERDLADRMVVARSQGAEAVTLLIRQVRHAIAMAKLETIRGEKPLEWFTGAVFSTNNFRRLVAKTATRTARAGPQGSAERAPRKFLSTTTSDEPDLSYKP